jgi:hypothetical protein
MTELMQALQKEIPALYSLKIGGKPVLNIELQIPPVGVYDWAMHMVKEGKKVTHDSLQKSYVECVNNRLWLCDPDNNEKVEIDEDYLKYLPTGWKLAA